jgi:hypothetical protein
MVKITRKAGKAKALRKVVEDMRKYTVAAGWNEAAKYSDGTPVAGVAAVQEFGSPKTGTPPRPFMRQTAANKSGEWTELSKRLFKSLSAGQGVDAKTIYGILGAKVAGDIRKTITEISSPELSPVTLALRRLKSEGKQITGPLVFAVKRAVATGETGPGQLGYAGGVSKKPLVDDAIMLNTLGSEVKEKSSV